LTRSTPPNKRRSAPAPIVAGPEQTVIHPARAGWSFVKPSVIPGFGLTLGYTITYLSLIVLIPLAALFLKSATLPWSRIVEIATAARTVQALWVSFGSSLIAALVNVIFGLIVAWVLVRYRFPGKRILDAVVDLPFALPTAVAGIALSTVYGQNGWIGWFVGPKGPLHLGWKIAYTPSGIVVALIGCTDVRGRSPLRGEFCGQVSHRGVTGGARHRGSPRQTSCGQTARPNGTLLLRSIGTRHHLPVVTCVIPRSMAARQAASASRAVAKVTWTPRSLMDLCVLG
jgi:hypothetical protein